VNGLVVGRESITYTPVKEGNARARGGEELERGLGIFKNKTDTEGKNRGIVHSTPIRVGRLLEKRKERKKVAGKCRRREREKKVQGTEKR